MKTKNCTTCNQIKPLEDFHKRSDAKDGRVNKCKSCSKIRRRKYTESGKEKAVYKGWSKERRKKHADSCEFWRKANPGLVVGYAAKSRAKRKKARPEWLTKEQVKWIRWHYKQAKYMEKLHNEKYHVDHIEPLIGKTSCGLHVPWNLQILEAGENKKKSNKL